VKACGITFGIVSLVVLAAFVMYLWLVASLLSLPNYPGAQQTYLIQNGGHCEVKTQITQDSPELVREFYREKMTSTGWSLRGENEYAVSGEPYFDLAYEKTFMGDAYVAGIGIFVREDKQTQLGIWTQKATEFDFCWRSEGLP
jgi:hypothetical protein